MTNPDEPTAPEPAPHGLHKFDPAEVVEAIADERDEHSPAPEINARAAQLTGTQRPLLIEAMGGPLGMAESSIPSVAFVIAITAGAEVKTSAIIAIGLAALLAVARIARRQTVQFALTGVIGVAISAYIASKTGQARDYFVPTFFVNVGYATLAFGSVLIRRPFIGYIVEGIAGGQGNWRDDPVKVRKFRLASMLWGSIFILRLVVQLPLYFANALVALGTAKIAMGYPLFGIGIWLTWLMLRTPAGDAPPEDAATPAGPGDAGD